MVEKVLIGAAGLGVAGRVGDRLVREKDFA